jgi:hypothetical protein
MGRLKVPAFGVGVVIMGLILLPTAWAQEQEPDYEATISALQTRVAELEAAVGESGAAVAPENPSPTPPISGLPAESEPIAINADFAVLYYYFAYDDGELAVYGEMQNVSSAGKLAPGIRFTFYDESGNSYGDDQAYPDGYWVEGGARMPFNWFSLLGGALAPGDWATVEVSAGDPALEYYVYDTSMLSIEEAPLEGPSESVSGRILNSGSAPVTGVTMYVAYFDEEGVYVGSCTGFSPSSDAIIPPGGGIRFEAGGGGCGTANTAITARDSQGPFTQRLILVRSE